MDRIGATTPPEERHRASTCCAPVAKPNWTPSTASTWHPVRASEAVSARLRSGVGNPRRLHLDDPERDPVGDHLANLGRPGRPAHSTTACDSSGDVERTDGADTTDHGPGASSIVQNSVVSLTGESRRRRWPLRPRACDSCSAPARYSCHNASLSAGLADRRRCIRCRNPTNSAGRRQRRSGQNARGRSMTDIVSPIRARRVQNRPYILLVKAQ